MYTYDCTVEKVVDGDTLDIVIDLGFNVKMSQRVRLSGIDTPEVFGAKATPEGKLASQFTTQWLAEQSSKPGQFRYISEKYNSRDKYGRCLGQLVFVTKTETKSLNEELIAKGWTYNK
jgi:micrococcal nuclease